MDAQGEMFFDVLHSRSLKEPGCPGVPGFSRLLGDASATMRSASRAEYLNVWEFAYFHKRSPGWVPGLATTKWRD
jgi:hypothetical protein